MLHKMDTHFFKVIVLLFLFNNSPLFAELNMQESIYDAAKEMIAFDKKMNRLIAEHNEIDIEDDENTIEDFEETETGYVLKTSIDGNNTKVDVLLKDRILTVSIVTTEKEVVKLGTITSYENTISSSSTSLSLPKDADEKSMKKSYEDGILEVSFIKK